MPPLVRVRLSFLPPCPVHQNRVNDSMPKLRDTSWDPFSSPDDRGLHPNAFRTQADPSKGTQERYETRLDGAAAERATRHGDALGPSPRVAIGSVTQSGGPAFGKPTAKPAAAPTGGGIGWLLGLGGLAFGAWALMRGGPKSNPGTPHTEIEPSGTYSLNAPTPTVQVTVNVGTPATNLAGAETPVVTTSSTFVPSPVAQIVDAEVVAVAPVEKPKRRHPPHPCFPSPRRSSKRRSWR